MAARDLKKASFWRRMVQAQGGSGMSVRAWCRRRRVKEVTFYWWRRELARRDAEVCVRRDLEVCVPRCAEACVDRETEKLSASFVPVRVLDDAPAARGSRIEIVLAGGQRVRVSGRVDRQTLADVLAVLATAPGAAIAEGCAAEGQAC